MLEENCGSFLPYLQKHLSNQRKGLCLGCCYEEFINHIGETGFRIGFRYPGYMLLPVKDNHLSVTSFLIRTWRASSFKPGGK